jgi:hypothetical protein
LVSTSELHGRTLISSKAFPLGGPQKYTKLPASKVKYLSMKIFNSSLKTEYIFWFPNISRTLIFVVALNSVSKLHDPKNFNSQNIMNNYSYLND